MTDEDRAKLKEIDELLDRFDSLSPDERARLDELNEWNIAAMKKLGLPIEELMAEVCDAQLSEKDDEWNTESSKRQAPKS